VNKVGILFYIESMTRIESHNKGNNMSTKETVVWATKVGEESWQEEVVYGGGKLLTEGQLSDCKEWCKANGFDRIRVKTLDLSVAPNFAQSVNI